MGTSLIGIGALFFAYAAVTDPFVRTIISLVGLGGSLTLGLHAYTMQRDRDGALDVLSESTEGEAFRRRVDRAGVWRHTGLSVYLVPSSTSAATWFLGWVSAAWLLIILASNFPRFWLAPYSPLPITICALAAGLMTYLWLMAVKDGSK
jgi:hypothetical protein